MQVAAEEKVRALQGKEAELQQLRQALRERDRLIEKINTAVLESQEKNKVNELKVLHDLTSLLLCGTFLEKPVNLNFYYFSH